MKPAQALEPGASPGADSAGMEPEVGQADAVGASVDVPGVAAVASVEPVFAVVVDSGTEG